MHVITHNSDNGTFRCELCCMKKSFDEFVYQFMIRSKVSIVIRYRVTLKQESYIHTMQRGLTVNGWSFSSKISNVLGGLSLGLEMLQSL